LRISNQKTKFHVGEERFRLTVEDKGDIDVFTHFSLDDKIKEKTKNINEG